MLKSLKKSYIGLLVLVGGCANMGEYFPNNEDQLPEEGTMVSDYVQVGRFEVPLPAGEWVVAESTAKPTAKVPTGKVTLVQSLEGAASNAVMIETPLGLDHTNYSANSESKLLGSQFTAHGEADIHDAIYTQTFYVDAPNTKKKTRGTSAFPSLMYIAPTKMKPEYYGKEFLESTGLDYPADDHFFRIGYEIVGGPSKLFVSYFIDPLAENVLVTKGDIKVSLWHPNRHYQLPEKEQVFLDKLEEWAEYMLGELVDAYDARI